MRLTTALWRRALAVTLGVLCLALAACGSHGVAAALSQPVTVRLAASDRGTSQSATFTLTPIHALHVAAYFGGHAIPLTGAKNPAQIRQNACTGPLVVNLSDGAPANAATPAAGAPPATQPDPAGGLDVAIEPGAQWYVIVYDHANDPSAAIVACGHPLSGERQYFDLYQAAEGPNGIALGTALFDPIVATRIEVSTSGTSSGMQPSAWALHSGSCTGPALASGAFPIGTTHGSSAVFHPLDTSGWWVSLSQGTGGTTCAKVG
jgi:hypothetical protein